VQRHVWGEVEYLRPLYCKFLGECDSERILKTGQYLMKLCVDYVGLLFLAHPVIMPVYWYFNFCAISDIVLLLLFTDASCPCPIQWRSWKLFSFRQQTLDARWRSSECMVGLAGLGSIVSSLSVVWAGAPETLFGHFVRNSVRFYFTRVLVHFGS